MVQIDLRIVFMESCSVADISLFESAFDMLHPKGMIQFLIGTAPDGRTLRLP